MGSHSPPKDSFDSADIENIEEAFKAVCRRAPRLFETPNTPHAFRFGARERPNC
jgi:hypothetical protein